MLSIHLISIHLIIFVFTIYFTEQTVCTCARTEVVHMWTFKKIFKKLQLKFYKMGVILVLLLLGFACSSPL